MDLIFTSFKGIFRINTSTMDIRKIHSGSGMYYGITWHNDDLYVVARNSSYDYKLGDERILIFNKDFDYVGYMDHQFVDCGLHEILINPDDGRLWLTASLKNKILIISNESCDEFYPNPLKVDIDFNHFNSLFFDGNMFITAHNKGISDSEIWEVSPNTLEVIDKYPMKECTCSHCCFKMDGKLATCASAQSSVKNIDGEPLLTSDFIGYTRGIAITDTEIAVGDSAIADHGNRTNADGWIHIFDRQSMSLKHKIHFPNIGQIAEIRSLNEKDYRHWPDPFLS